MRRLRAVGRSTRERGQPEGVARTLEPSGQSGTRAGALIASASLLATGLNYVFLVFAARLLGSEDYGVLAALLGLLTVVLLPTGALQLAVSREVSRRLAVGDEEGADTFARALLRLGSLVTVPLVAGGLVLVVPLRQLLDIDSTGAVTLAMVGLVIALVFPIALGVLQGYQRFTAVAAMYVFPFVARLALLAVVALAGFRLGGAVFAAVAGGVVSAVVALWTLREPLRRGARATEPALAPFIRYLWPVVVGLVGIAVLTNLDLLVVKARFSAGEAGQYAAAAAFAKIAFFLPATILAVLFPRTAARQARGEGAADILGRSLIVTAAFGALLGVFYGMAGRGLVHTSFGADFAEGGELLVPFTVSMILFALANVCVGFHLSRGETRFAWLVAAIVPLQVVALTLVPQTPRSLIWVNVAVGVTLLVAHETAAGSSIGALREGGRHLLAEIRVPRRVLTEAALVLLATTAFVSVLFWPMVSGLGSTLIAFGSDAVGGVWTFWRMQEEGGYHVFGTTHHTLTSAPFGWDEGNGLNLQWLLPYYPGYLMTAVVGEVAAYNLVLLAGYVLSGAAMYLLVRYLGCAPLVAAWAGMAYVVFPWHLMRTPHASLTHLELFPLLALVLVAAAQRPTWGRFGLVGFVVLGCWLTSGYFGTMALVTAAAFALAALLLSSRRHGAIVAWGTAGAVLAASLVVVTLTMVAGVSRDVGREPDPRDLSGYGVRAVELLVPSDRNLVVGDTLRSFWEDRAHGSNPTETSNYLGLLTIALAFAWLAVAWRGRRALSQRLRLATLGLLLTGVAALALSAPSPVRVLGYELVMPSRLLFEMVPAFRVPSRWIPLVMTALIPLAALGLQSAVHRIQRAGRGSVAVGTVVATAVVLSFLELAVWPAQPLLRADVPPEYRALERAPDGILAEYPLVEEIDRQFWQREHGRPTLNPLAFGTPIDEARRVLLHPDAPGTAAALSFLGVKAIVTHGEAFDYGNDVRYVPKRGWGPGYSLVARTAGGTSVWEVVAPAAPALVTLQGGFGELRLLDGYAGYPLDQPAGVGTIAFVARAPSVARVHLDAVPPSGERRVLRIGDEQRELTRTLRSRTLVSVLVEIPRGRSYIVVKTDPPATGAKDAILFSTPRAETALGEPALRAVPVSPDPKF